MSRRRARCRRRRRVEVRVRLPADDLYKAFNADLQTECTRGVRVPVAMSYTNDDQNAIALDINNGMTPEEAAQKWIDANPDVWQPWVDAGLAAQG